MTSRRTLTALATLAAVLAPAAGHAATAKFQAVLKPLNESGVSGIIRFTVDDVAQTLRVRADVAGLAPNQVHVNHIHGLFEDDDNDFVPNEPRVPVNSVTPTPAADMDGDGFVEVLEGAPLYGDILFSLNDPDMPGVNPVANDAGELSYDYFYDLSMGSPLLENSVAGNVYTFDDLTPFTLREYVVHGDFVPAGVIAEDADAGYYASLPVAAAEISPVPVPAAGVLLLGALGGLGLMRRRRAPAQA